MATRRQIIEHCGGGFTKDEVRSLLLIFFEKTDEAVASLLEGEREDIAGNLQELLKRAGAPVESVHEHNLKAFKKLLFEKLIADPDKDVLDHIRLSKAYQLRDAVETADADFAARLYDSAKKIPKASTRVRLLDKANLAVDGEFIGAGKHGDLCTANDVNTMVPWILKSGSKNEEIFCNFLEKNFDEEKCSGLVPVSVVRWKDVEDTENPIRRDRFYIKMPMYSGTLVGLSRQISAQAIHREVKRMIGALDMLHQLGYVHMDVKPSNIFIDMEGQWRLGDFGACTKENDVFKETTAGFLQKELYEDGVATFQCDWCMLAAAILAIGLPTIDIATRYRTDGYIDGAKIYDELQNTGERFLLSKDLSRDIFKLLTFKGRSFGKEK